MTGDMTTVLKCFLLDGPAHNPTSLRLFFLGGLLFVT